MSKYLVLLLMASACLALVALTGCGTPGEDLLLYWSAMEKL